MGKSKPHDLFVEKVAPGSYAVSVGGDDGRADIFFFKTERDGDRFVRAGSYAVRRVRTR